jgi:hypothetical protein
VERPKPPEAANTFAICCSPSSRMDFGGTLGQSSGVGGALLVFGRSSRFCDEGCLGGRGLPIRLFGEARDEQCGEA